MIGCIVRVVIIALIVWIIVSIIKWSIDNVLPYLLGGAALYGAGIALWNYGRAFANNVKPERPTP